MTLQLQCNNYDIEQHRHAHAAGTEQAAQR